MLTFGFYNSINGDRTYNATQFAALFDGIFNVGIFSKIGDAFAISINSGMTMNVGTGRAWFNQTWTNSDAVIALTLDASEIVLDRIDSIILEIDNTAEVRANSIKVLKGTPGSSPVAPTLSQSNNLYQYAMANIYVGAGVTTILPENVTSLIGTNACPYVSGLLGSGQMLGNALTKVFSYNAKTVEEDITVPANTNASAVGPITIADGYTVLVEDGAELIIL